MAFAPSRPENIGEREFSVIADGLFNGELDERAARLAQQEREQQREFSLLTDEVERMRLFNEELDDRAARLGEREREFERKLIQEMREFEEYKAYQAGLQEQRQREEWAAYNARLSELRLLETNILAREQLQRGREAELAHWQSSLEAREDELATAQAQLGEERDAVERQRRRLDEIEHLNSPPVSPPPEGDF